MLEKLKLMVKNLMSKLSDFIFKFGEKELMFGVIFGYLIAILSMVGTLFGFIGWLILGGVGVALLKVGFFKEKAFYSGLVLGFIPILLSII